MLGRDPGESHRASTTLELLFDLTFVVAISLCGAQLAHAVAAGHTAVSVTAYVIEGEAALCTLGATLAVAIPLGLTLIGVYVFATYLFPEGKAFHLAMVALILVVLATAVALAAAGVPIAWCLGLVVLSPWLAVAAYELRGHAVFAELMAQPGISDDH